MNGHISTLAVKSDVTVMFLSPDFLSDVEISANLAVNKGYIAYFSLHMHETAVFSLPVKKSDIIIMFVDPDFLRCENFGDLHTFNADIGLLNICMDF